MTDKNFMICCYLSYALSYVTQFGSFLFMSMGTGIILITLALLYRRRKSFAHTAFESHATWLIRTLWIGGSLWLPLLTVLSAVYFTLRMDISRITTAWDSGDILTEAEILSVFMNDNAALLQNIFTQITLIFGLWWFWRCGTGFKQLIKNQSVKNPLKYF